MESMLGRLLSAAAGVALVFYLTFASNSVEYAEAEAEARKQQSQLSAAQVVAAYQAMAGAPMSAYEAEARARYFDANAVVHAETSLACHVTADYGPIVTGGGDIMVSHRRFGEENGLVLVAEVFRVSDGRIVEYWQSRADLGLCEQGE